MPKNTKGGNKAKGQKNSSGPVKNREIAIPEASMNTHVAVITKVLGDSRYTTNILNETGVQKSNIMVYLRPSAKRKTGSGIILKPGNYVLVAQRDFNNNEFDIIFLYRDSEISFLIENGYIPTENKGSITEGIEFSEAGGSTVQDLSLMHNNKNKSTPQFNGDINSVDNPVLENETIDYDAI